MASINPEQLIECVRKYEVLYDPSQEHYRNVDYKDRIWNKVAKELNVEGQGEECKKKWNGIRDSLRRARQKRTTKSGLAATASNKYKFEAILEFLIPHLAERKGLSNIPDEKDNNETTESQQPNSFQETIPDDLNVHGSDETVESPLPPPSTPNCEVSVDSRPLSCTKRKRRLTVDEKNPEESAASQLMAYLLTEKKKESNENDGQHPVDAFLAGIAPSLKSLDPIRLLTAKGKIFNIVQEYELEQLRDISKQQCRTVYAKEHTSDTNSCTIVKEEEAYDGPCNI